jgi:hypothetical protein
VSRRRGGFAAFFTFCRFWLPLLVAASGCRFYCRFSLPFLVAVLKSQITAWYNVV